ncbi:MAG: hypothetical protein J6P93_04765, partial [Alphaproteobacteria bacterium]|nr:hypothetical protein [Alphaproteobacteria bacterium]
MQIKKTLYLLSTLTFAAVTLGLTACGNHIKEVEDNVQLVLDETETYMEQAKIPYKPEPIDTVSVKEDIWLGQSSFKITGGEPFPADMEAPDALTLSFAEPVTLADLVVDLHEMTGLKFSLDELRATEELPEEAFKLNYTGSLSGLLDYISNKYSIWWKNHKGQVSFYKMETRVFTVYALPVESSMSASLSGTPITDGAGGGGNTTLSMSTDVKLSFWESIENAITQVMGEQGEMFIDSTSGTITVTAPPFVMQKIARYVQDLNEKMSRQVAISVKVLQVVLSNDDKYGLDLKAAFNSSRLALSTTPVFTPAQGAVGTLTMTLLDTKWKDSSAIIQAISEQGKTSLVTSTSVTTLNNKVAPVQVTTQENYVKETTVSKDSYSSGSGSTSVDMDTDTLNYGFTMEILPRILDNGRLILLFSMTLTDLVSLTTFSSSGTDPSLENRCTNDSDCPSGTCNTTTGTCVKSGGSDSDETVV